MTAIDYYRERFATDLTTVMGAPTSRGGRISIIVFRGSGAPGDFGAAQERFGRLPRMSRVRFLFCLHFSVLIDQAIHDRARHLHADFDRVAGYPKLAGILGSYWNNVHPALLLEAATRHIEPGAAAETAEFTEYARYFREDYRRFFMDEFPRHSRGLPDVQSRTRALDQVMDGIRDAYTLFGAPGPARGGVADGPGPQPDARVYAAWLDIVRREFRAAG